MANGFCAVSVNIASVGAGAQLGGIVGELYGLRYGGSLDAASRRSRWRRRHHLRAASAGGQGTARERALDEEGEEKARKAAAHASTGTTPHPAGAAMSPTIHHDDDRPSGETIHDDDDHRPTASAPLTLGVWSLSLITPPAAEPLDLETEVYPHLRLEPELTPQETLLRVARRRRRGSGARPTRPGSASPRRGSCGSTVVGRMPMRRTTRQRRIYLPRAPLQPQGGAPGRPTAGVLSVSLPGHRRRRMQALAPDQYMIDAPQGPHERGGARSSRRTRCGRGRGSGPAGRRADPFHGRLRRRTSAPFPRGSGKGCSSRSAELDGSREDQTVGTIVAPNILRAEQLWYPFRVW